MRLTLFLIALALSFYHFFFSQPVRLSLYKTNFAFVMEKPTHLPEGYRDLEESKYFNVKDDFLQRGYSEVEYRFGENFLKFNQGKDTELLRLYLESQIPTDLPKREDVNVNNAPAVRISQTDGVTRIYYTRDKKRYEFKTNQALSLREIEEIDESLVPVEIDFLYKFKEISRFLRSLR